MTETTNSMNANDSHVYDQLAAVLEVFRPILWSEGGDAQILGVKDGDARISMGGGCEGCGGSLQSIEGGLRTTLMERVPGLKTVTFE